MPIKTKKIKQTSELKIIQIIPCEHNYAMVSTDTGERDYLPIIAWALVENNDGQRTVMPMGLERLEGTNPPIFNEIPKLCIYLEPIDGIEDRDNPEAEF